ncbi:recombinase family protein [Streptomyces sp. YGL11-2]|uniref:recombinase family protein n=1 Tax=Streptomyces sp. YGL11-2 TaxID=3414028 RepID=UPI003CECFD3F
MSHCHPEHAPLAFIYDRCAGRARRRLDMRLDGCRSYAEHQGWTVVGLWIDLGDHALSAYRPRHAALLDAMREGAGGCSREALCLVHSMPRLATDPTHRLVLQRRIAEAGGRTVTTFGAYA